MPMFCYIDSVVLCLFVFVFVTMFKQLSVSVNKLVHYSFLTVSAYYSIHYFDGFINILIPVVYFKLLKQ